MVGMQMMIDDGENAWEWNSAIYNGKVKGLINHTNVQKGKSDTFPQPELIELIKRL